jgi:hypothetical protein
MDTEYNDTIDTLINQISPIERNGNFFGKHLSHGLARVGSQPVVWMSASSRQESYLLWRSFKA